MEKKKMKVKIITTFCTPHDVTYKLLKESL